MPAIDADEARPGDSWNGSDDPERLVCCFCARRLGKKPAVRWTIDYADGSWQPFWSHIDCLLAKLHPAVPIQLRPTKKRPNKALEPTPGAVTPRATEGASR